MRRVFVAILAFMFSCGHAASDELPTYGTVFESVCIGSNLVPANVGALLAALSPMLNGSVSEMAKEDLVLMGPGISSGWLLKTQHSAFFVTIGIRRDDTGATSTSCTIDIRTDDAASVGKYVESHFRVKKIIDETQGSSAFIAYVADLIGFTKRVAISIQSGNGVVALSLYEL
ncbi:hypothetical protein [Mesorhizobium sp.]|uniref:hypothetical protein n=1 Tax=Mesorhizobium sp. TaxID=1871066 RepID=UPI000FE6A433|nr:hypothetical protein [Mesorhizobium sp.]RWO46328.1 MAG: hypothetical protein EOS13_26870 [Mesorhizobium sp.]